jgi:hypothetical protein
MQTMKTVLLSILLAASLSAASITGITCASGVATVTVANSLVASQGFEITGTSVATYNINGTAVSANSTSFTFKTTCAGSATGGTFAPAVQIVNSGVTPNNSGATVNYILWLTTTVPTPCPSCSSNYAGNAAQLAALQAGTTVEAVGSFGIANGETPTQMNAAILAIYTAAQSTVSQGLSQYVGWCYNGSSWASTCN